MALMRAARPLALLMRLYQFVLSVPLSAPAEETSTAPPFARDQHAVDDLLGGQHRGVELDLQRLRVVPHGPVRGPGVLAARVAHDGAQDAVPRAEDVVGLVESACVLCVCVCMRS